MSTKTINGRIVHKHDTEINWSKATNFIPMAGELIVYDIDDAYDYERIKIGDGITNVNTLPFVDDFLRTELTAQINELNDSVDTISTLVGDASVSEQISTAVDGKMNAEDPVGTGSFSMGRKNGTTVGDYSHTEGRNTTASSYGAHAEGVQTTASGNYSHAEGYNTAASGHGSHAEGIQGTSSGDYSHVEGFSTTASGVYSHAEGESATASGAGSHAEGYKATTSGNYSHVEGYNTTASGQGTHVQGAYNIDGNEGTSRDERGKYVHIVGNGTDADNRSNAHTLDWDGNAWFSGKIKIGGESQDDAAAKNIATEDYVVDALEAAISTKANASDLTSHTENKSNPHGVTVSQIGAVPTSRTINSKALSANITLTASDVGADASGAASSALTSAKAYTDSEIAEWVGDTTVSEQISEAVATKADASHTHNAYVNQNAFSNVVVGSTTVAADSATDTLTLAAGSNITITPDATNDKITIAATDTVYTHPSYTARTGAPTANQTPAFGGTFTVSQPVSDSTGHITAVNNRTVTIPSTAATTSAAGLMSASDKTTLSNLSTLVGDTSVASQISNATSGSMNGNAATATKVNNNLAIKLNSGTTEGTNLFTFNGSAAKTVNITPSAIGAAASSHGTHVSYGTSAAALGTSSAGTATTVSRSDHVHALPALTSCTGTLTVAKGGTGATTAAGVLTNLGLTATATELNYCDGVTSNIQTQLDAKAASSHTHSYAASSSADGAAKVSESDKGITTAGTGAAYTATVSGITALSAGVSFIMIPHTVSTSTAPTLNVNSLGAKTIARRLSNLGTGVQAGYTAGWLASGVPFRVTYDGTQWVVSGMEKPVAADLYGTLAINKGGTGATTVAGAQAALGIVDLIYPIGSIYMSVNDTSPETLFGGTWEQIKDTFLLSAGDTYEAGSTGGEAEHTLTTDETPSHYHEPYPKTRTEASENYAYAFTTNLYLASDSVARRKFGAGNSYYTMGSTSTEDVYQATRTTAVGGGNAHNNMPPYLTVYVWKRVS